MACLRLLAGAALLGSLMTTAPASATIIAGALTINGNVGHNYFSPGEGHVPSGYGNSSGTVVPVGANVEFAFQEVGPSVGNLDTADFTATSLTIIDVTDPSVMFTLPFTMTFAADTPGFFNSAHFTLNTFGGTLLVTDDTLVFSAPDFFLRDGTRVATITFGNSARAPEPASWAMMLVGFSLVGCAMRNRVKASLSFR